MEAMVFESIKLKINNLYLGLSAFDVLVPVQKLFWQSSMHLSLASFASFISFSVSNCETQDK